MKEHLIKSSRFKTRTSDERYIRKYKLSQLRKKGFSFPNHFRRSMISNQLHEFYDKKSNEELKKLDLHVQVAGRLIYKRIFGKISFFTMQDMGGTIQIYIDQEKISAIQYNETFKKLDLGDIIGVNGTLFKTNTEELSINCSEIFLLTKSIRPLPEKFHGLSDQEICYRNRYLDLIVNKKSRKTFQIRSRIIRELRFFMNNLDFIEVETPMMQTIPGGAIARPFITHHNSLDIDIYLRIAPELYLKRLVVGGFEKIFEINRNFRNEGLSPDHNPEFTMMEIYMAYADYQDMIKLSEKLFKMLVKEILGKTTIKYENENINFEKPFIKMTMQEAICLHCPRIKSDLVGDFMYSRSFAKSIGIKVEKNWELGRIQTEIFEKEVKRHLIQPTFITEYPVEVSPLARRNEKNQFLTDRFEIFIAGKEIGNGFSELNDPEEQKSRFLTFLKKNKEYQSLFYDEEYIIALEHGLPPTAGLGIGIDRLVMLLTNNKGIKDVIFFPILRKKKNLLSEKL